MKSTVLYIALCVLFNDLVNAKSSGVSKPKPNGKPASGPQPSNGPGPVPGPVPGPIPGPMPGPLPQPMPSQMLGPMQGGGPMGGPGCGGCAQSQEPKQCPAICMRWNTIIKPNGEVENGPASITPLSPSERVGPNGIFPPMNSVSPMFPQPMMAPPMTPGAGMPNMGVPALGGQPPQGPKPAQEKNTSAPGRKY